MRRSNKEIIDQAAIEAVLQANHLCRIAFTEQQQPYLVPMNYGYSSGRIFLHCAREGRKLAIIQTNNNVCFEVTDSIALKDRPNAGDFGTIYRSVIGFGTIAILDDQELKRSTLQIIMLQHTGTLTWPFSEPALAAVLLLQITISSITGKVSGNPTIPPYTI